MSSYYNFGIFDFSTKIIILFKKKMNVYHEQVCYVSGKKIVESNYWDNWWKQQMRPT